jgi:hypothetical protein
MPAIAILVWLALGFACAFIAKEKNRPPITWFVCGVLLGPIGLVLALFAKRWYYDERLKITGSEKYLEQTWASLSPEQRALYDEDEDDDDETGAPPDSVSAEIARLADLHRAGTLSDSEFEAAKARLLGLR